MEAAHIRCDGFGAIVDAYAIDGRDLWFLSLAGSQGAVRAIWAKLVKGDHATISSDLMGGGRYCSLARGVRGSCHLHTTRLPVTGATHALLVPDAALYAHEQQDFLLLPRSEEDAPTLHYRFLTRRIDLPLHPSWSDWLWERGLQSGEVKPLDAMGVRAWRCEPKPPALQEALGRALRGHRIPVPAEPFAAAA